MSGRRPLISPRKPVVPPIDKKERLKDQMSTIESKMFQNIQNQQINISQKKKPYLSQTQEQNLDKQKYRKILQEKKKMEEKLSKIRTIERQYQTKLNLSQINETRSKSQLTNQNGLQRKKMRKLKQNYYIFEKSLQYKTLQYQQNRKKMFMKQQQQKQKNWAAKNQLKKIEIMKRISDLQIDHQERMQKNRIQKRQIKKLKEKKKLFQSFDQQFHSRESQIQKKKYEQMKERMQSKNVDFKQIKEHQKKYQQIMAQKKKQLEQKRFQLSRMSRISKDSSNAQISTYSIQKSKYYTMVIRQDRKAKREQEEKKNVGKLIQQKRLKYAQYVKQQFAPRIKTKQQQQQQEYGKKSNIEPESKIKRIDAEQIKKIGNMNLVMGNKKARKKSASQHKNIDYALIVANPQQNLQKSKVKNSFYPDYLQQIKQKNKNNVQIGPKEEAKKIMSDARTSKQQKLAKIQLLNQRYNAKNNDMVTKIMGKLQILQMIN